jgi:hypothetical protein
LWAHLSWFASHPRACTDEQRYRKKKVDAREIHGREGNDGYGGCPDGIHLQENIKTFKQPGKRGAAAAPERAGDRKKKDKAICELTGNEEDNEKQK